MGQMSPERQKRLKAEADRNATGGNYYKFSNKQTDTIRILPYAEGEDLGLKVVSHFIQNKSYVCPFGTAGRPSVIERARAALSKINKPLAQEFAATLEASKRTKFILKVISRLNESQPVIMEAPYKIYQTALDAGKEDGDDVTSILEGCDIRWSKEGNNKGTKYSARTLKPSPLLPTKEDRKALLAAAKDVSREDSIRFNEKGAVEALKELLPEDLWSQIKKQVLSALASTESDDSEAEGDDEDADESSTKSKKSKKSEDDDEDAEDADGADDDEDEDAPKGKKSKKTDDEDDEEGDDADDDEEDEKPKGKKSKSEDDEDADEDEKPAKSKKSSKSDADEDDADDDEEDEKPKGKTSKSDADEDEDDEDAEEAPKGKKTGKTSKKSEDEDEDEDAAGDDDEDEDEAPAKPATGKSKNGKKYEVEEDDEEEAKPAKSKKK